MTGGVRQAAVGRQIRNRARSRVTVHIKHRRLDSRTHDSSTGVSNKADKVDLVIGRRTGAATCWRGACQKRCESDRYEQPARRHIAFIQELEAEVRPSEGPPNGVRLSCGAELE